jgi:biotin transport system substrate-specific component
MTATTSATLLHLLAARGESAASVRAVRIASVLFMTALTAAAAQVSIPVPFTQVPFTLQPMVVLLSGLTLGARLGLASQALYLAAGVAGLPVFAASVTLPPGALRLLGPTGGFLMSYPLAAFVTGYLAERGFARRYVTSVVAMAAGLVVVHASGTLWLGLFARSLSDSAALGLRTAFLTSSYPFLVPDLIKLAAAGGIVPALWHLVGASRAHDRRQ